MIGYIGPLPVLMVKGNHTQTLVRDYYESNPGVGNDLLSDLTDSSLNDIINLARNNNAFTILSNSEYTELNPLVLGDFHWYVYERSPLQDLYPTKMIVCYVIEPDGGDHDVFAMPYDYLCREVIIPEKIDYFNWILYVDEYNHLGVCSIRTDKNNVMYLGSHWEDFTTHMPFVEFDESDYVTPPEPVPEPEPEEGGRFSLENRFSPRIASNSFGMYVMNRNELQDLMKGLWNKSFAEWVSQSIGMATKPEDMLLGCKWYYGLRKDVLLREEKCVVTMGNLIIESIDGNTDVKYNHPNSILRKEFCTFETDVLHITPYFNNYVDYACKYQLFVPFVGYVNLNPSDILDGDIKLTYNINLASGQALVIVSAKNARTENKFIEMMVIPCDCSIDIPLNFTQINGMVSNFARVGFKAATVGAGVATMGSSGILALGVAGSYDKEVRIQKSQEQGVDIAPSMVEKISDKLYNGKKDYSSTLNDYRNFSDRFGKATSQTADAFGNVDIASIDRSGSLNSESGTIGPLTPYMLITRPVKITPPNLNKYFNYRSINTTKLANCKGYTKVLAVSPDSIPNNNKYISEIISLLELGVYL